MRKMIFVLVTFVIGCGTASPALESRLANLQASVDRLQKNDRAQRQYIARLEATRNASAPSVATSPPAVEPKPASPALATPAASAHVAALVHGQPPAYQCFLGDMPGMAPGHWVEVRNFDRQNYLYMTINDAPVIVMRPTANGTWEPLFPGRQDRTVLPPGRKCNFHASARLNGDGTLKEYFLRADAYSPAMGSMPGVVILESYPSAKLMRPWEFHLSRNRTTAVSLEPYQFN